MTEPQDSEPDYAIPFERRDLLKLAGAGAIGAFGAETATAKPRNDFVVGVEHGRADVAKQRANAVKREIDFGPDIGEAIAGRWPEQALQGLRNNPHVRYVEEDCVGEYQQQALPWGVDRIDAEFAHANGDTGGGISVAIIDSGIDSDHDDLAANLGAGHAPADPCGSCAEDWDDTLGHGTAVAGIVGAIDNTQDVIGVAPDATLHAIKVGDTAPSSSAVAEALTIAGDEGYDVANLSLSVGPSCPDDPNCVEDGIQHAKDNDVVIVSSAGNAGPCSDCVGFPASHDDVIAVSNIARDDTLANTSSQGPEVDLGAPGAGVTSTALGGETGGFGGTSAASPHVAAAVAQLLADGTASSNVRSVLKSNAEDIGLNSNRQGAGLLDLAASLGHDSANDLVEVETDFPTSVGFTETRLNGELVELTGNDDAKVSFEYRKDPAGSWIQTSTQTLSSTGTFHEDVTGLEEDTIYDYRAVVTVEEPSEGWSSTERGDQVSFETEDNLPPTASLTHDPAVPDPGETVTFDAAGSTDPEGDTLTYDWDFENDGTFDDSGETVTHSYPDPGDVTVRLRVTDEFDQTDETTQQLRVNAPPEAAFEHSPNVPNEGDDVDFDASDSVDPDGDIVEYKWEFGDGDTETTTSPTVTHNYGPVDEGNWGEFDVTLTVTDNDDATDEITQTVRINAYPRADFNVSVGGDPMDRLTNPVVRNEPVEFDAGPSDDPNPGGSIVAYEWDFGDGTTATGETVTHTYSSGGVKTVRLRVTDDDGASHDELSVHEETFTVYIRAGIEIRPNADPNSINPNDRGNIAVAVLHTSMFDSPARLDHSTVHFGDPDDVGFVNSTAPEPNGGATPAHSGGHVEDVDGDGDNDSLFHFPTRDAGFERDDDEGELVGLTNDGVPVFGTDSVNIVGGGRS